jgi:hypothetical protein
MPKIPLSRDRAWALVMRNVALPGWGSLQAGKRLAGTMELWLALGGFFLLVFWMFKWMIRIAQSEMDEDLSPVPSSWIWESGVICIVIAWIGTMVSCFHLMREARAYEAEIHKNPPPVLSDLPKPPKL